MLEEVKNYLNITWEDADIDKKIAYLIDESKSYLQSLTGTTLDFDTDSEVKGLLKDRVRYAYNNANEYFEENFSNQILRLQLREGVKELERQKTNND